ncbi:MAG: hypothetical protein KOO60_11100 [Gemmatimonadales bacterium]|nr:hypothetical protein [Gemmatimonadales bacterium]
MKTTVFITLILLLAGCPLVASAQCSINCQVPYSHKDLAKAGWDTLHLMGATGSGAVYKGDFEGGSTLPLDGWEGVDLSVLQILPWKVAPNPVTGNPGYVCGTLYNGDWGYSNNWYHQIEWHWSVDDPFLTTTLSMEFNLMVDAEEDADFLNLYVLSSEGCPQKIASYTGRIGSLAEPEPISLVYSFLPGEYYQEDEIVVMFRFESDAHNSDADGYYGSKGACWLDDILMTSDAPVTIHDYTDFNSGSGNWSPPPVQQKVGMFAKIWSNLDDVDPNSNHYNKSNVVAFIDDGTAAPCLPDPTGSHCQTACYGPMGLVINVTGGLTSPEGRLHNAINSPVMGWPSSSYGHIRFQFDVFRDAYPNGVYYGWRVRSTDSLNSDDILTKPWKNRGWLYFGWPEWGTFHADATGLMVADRKFFQIQLFVWDCTSACSGFTQPGYDAPPAPYFDNVRIKLYKKPGPCIWDFNGIAICNPRELYVPSQVQEPVSKNLGDLDVRFDLAKNIALPEHFRVQFGDSIVYGIKSVRVGGSLTRNPRLHWEMQQNPLFGPEVRTSEFGTATSGFSEGWIVDDQPDLWAFDLPDEDFLYPGDILHYYIEASDEVAGVVETATLPEDLNGFGDFSSQPLAFEEDFVVRAIPTLAGDGTEAPSILFWNDFGNLGGLDKWVMSFRNLGLVEGRDFDMYSTRMPGVDWGDGLGNVLPLETLELYDIICYSSGDLGMHTLGNGDFESAPSDDIALLSSWLDTGDKHLLLTGNGLAGDLSDSGGQGLGFLGDKMGVTVEAAGGLQAQIGNQRFPIVRRLEGNPVFFAGPETWTVVPMEEYWSNLDAVLPWGEGTRLAEFLGPGEIPGAYPYSAATLTCMDNGSAVISLPYDLMFISSYSSGVKSLAPLPYRTVVLQEILAYFGIVGNPQDASAVPDVMRFSVGNHPNPFNPQTTIAFELPRQESVRLRVFDVGGRLVKELIGGEIYNQGRHEAVWNGRDGGGKIVASGTYFYCLEAGELSETRRMVLIK